MMNAKKNIGKYLLLFFSLLSFDPGLVNSFAASPDTLHIKKGESLIFNDSIKFYDHDTTLILPDDIVVIRPGDKYLKSRKFYDSLQLRARSKKWKNNLYRLFFVPNRNIARNPDREKKSTQEYQKYAGKIIRSIRFYQIDPFGPNVRDTLLIPETRSGQFLNKFHTTTRTKTIRHNLFFSEGDRVNPELFADNERLIRQLPFIRDAHFLLFPVSDNRVDVVVITKDVFSLGANYSFHNLNAGELSVFDNNLMGLGQKLSIDIPYDFNYYSHPIGTGAGYEISNIGNSFITGKVKLYNAFETQLGLISLQRPFFNIYIKNAGGYTSSITYTHDVLNHDTIKVPLKYFYNDLWYSRSFLLNKNLRRRLVLSGRYIRNNVMQRPLLGEGEYYQYQRYQLILGGLTYSRDQYFKSGLIYGYGTTEDIPEGMMASVTGGYEINEYRNRFYGGIELSGGKYFKRFGYINSGIKIGGYMPKDVVNAGIISVRTNYFSSLIPVGPYYFRQFVDINFTSGINRYSEERLTINDQYGIRGLRSDSLTGIRRLAIKTETVGFTPFYLYGFRFAFFVFADLGIIDFGNIHFTDNRLYSGFGLGVRIRNENLVFNTLQIRIAFYPVLPPGTTYQTVVLSGEKQFSPYNFIPHKPGIFEFR